MKINNDDRKSIKHFFAFMLIVGAICFFLVSCDGKIQETTFQTDEQTTSEDVIETINKLETSNGIIVAGDEFLPNTTIEFKVNNSDARKDEVKNLISTLEYYHESDFRVFDISLNVQGSIVDLSKPLTITIPLEVLDLIKNKKYLLYQIDDGKLKKTSFLINDSVICFSFDSYSTFVIYEKIVVHVHNYDYHSNRIEPTFLSEGTEEYYRCSQCGKIFDKNKNEIDDNVIPRLSPEMALFVNGNYVCEMELEESDRFHLTWKSVEVNVSKLDVISVGNWNNGTMYDFEPDLESNISLMGKVKNDAVAVVTVTYTYDRLVVSVSGYEPFSAVVRVIHDGVATDYPMKKVGSLENLLIGSCFWGYYDFTAGDSFVIIDNKGNTYGYNNLPEQIGFYPTGLIDDKNGEIVFKQNVKAGMSFDSYSELLQIDFLFGQNYGDNFLIEFKGDDNLVRMEKGELTIDFVPYQYQDGVAENTEDVREYFTHKGLCGYLVNLSVSSNAEFRIFDKDNSQYIESSHFRLFLDYDESIIVSGDYIKFLRSGNYYVVYMGFSDSIIIINEALINELIGFF